MSTKMDSADKPLARIVVANVVAFVKVEIFTT